MPCTIPRAATGAGIGSGMRRSTATYVFFRSWTPEGLACVALHAVSRQRERAGDVIEMATMVRLPPPGEQMPHERRRLVETISSLSLLRDAPIQLSSGRTSSFYFDMKPTLFDP